MTANLINFSQHWSELILPALNASGTRYSETKAGDSTNDAKVSKSGGSGTSSRQKKQRTNEVGGGVAAEEQSTNSHYQIKFGAHSEFDTSLRT